MKTVVLSSRSKDKLLHIEAPGCIVNIQTGLYDRAGNAITSVSIKCDEYAGEPNVTMPDFPESPRFLGVRVVRECGE